MHFGHGGITDAGAKGVIDLALADSTLSHRRGGADSEVRLQ
ncbi:MAG: hypothetical protein ACK4UN_08015 [Limisphaerales bacterium]